MIPRHISSSPPRSFNRSGFTLIELSLVLVIISMITGAIIGGQALIQQARIQHLISDVNSYKTAINVFQTQYAAYPGDFSNAYAYFAKANNDNICGPSVGDIRWSCNGNGDGILGYDPTGEQESIAEGTRAWIHLDLADILHKVTYQPGGFYGCVNTVKGKCGGSSPPNVPLSALNNLTGFIISNPRNFTGTYYGRTGAWLTLTMPGDPDVSGTWGGTNIQAYLFNRSITPTIAQYIDKKFDDGLPTTGDVLATSPWDNSTLCTTAGVEGAAIGTTMPSRTFLYNVSNTTNQCTLLFYIGG